MICCFAQRPAMGWGYLEQELFMLKDIIWCIFRNNDRGGVVASAKNIQKKSLGIKYINILISYERIKRLLFAWNIC